MTLEQENEPECRCTMRQRMVGDGCCVCNPEYAADHDPVEPAPTQSEQQPVGWQFYQDGKWWNGDDRIKDHRKNTEAAGIPVRDLYAAPIAQTTPRCQCCGYLVTDSEHRGCLRAATPQPEQSGLVDIKRAEAAFNAVITYMLGEGRWEEPIEFLRCWNEGNFDALREQWPEAPLAIYYADSLADHAAIDAALAVSE